MRRVTKDCTHVKGKTRKRCQRWAASTPYRAVSENTFSMGTRPFDEPLVPRMWDLVARMLWMDSPMPPAYLEMHAHVFSVSKMPSMESSCGHRRREGGPNGVSAIYQCTRTASRHTVPSCAPGSTTTFAGAACRR